MNIYKKKKEKTNIFYDLPEESSLANRVQPQFFEALNGEHEVCPLLNAVGQLATEYDHQISITFRWVNNFIFLLYFWTFRSQYTPCRL